MQRLEVSGAVRLIYRSLGVKELIVEAIDFAHRAVFFVTYRLLFFFFFKVGQDERCIKMGVAEIREDEIYTEMNAASSSSIPNAV